MSFLFSQRCHDVMHYVGPYARSGASAPRKRPPRSRRAALSDGAIVGSAIVRLVAEHGQDAVSYVADYVRSMADAVHGAAGGA